MSFGRLVARMEPSRNPGLCSAHRSSPQAALTIRTVTGDKMSNDDAYTIVKTLVEKKADIVAVHKEAESFSLDNQVQERSPIPFHPGALKYFKEKGIGG